MDAVRVAVLPVPCGLEVSVTVMKDVMLLEHAAKIS